MKFCNKCGNRLSDEAKFCNKCGNAILNKNVAVPHTNIKRKTFMPKLWLGFISILLVAVTVLVVYKIFFTEKKGIQKGAKSRLTISQFADMMNNKSTNKDKLSFTSDTKISIKLHENGKSMDSSISGNINYDFDLKNGNGSAIVYLNMNSNSNMDVNENINENGDIYFIPQGDKVCILLNGNSDGKGSEEDGFSIYKTLYDSALETLCNINEKLKYDENYLSQYFTLNDHIQIVDGVECYNLKLKLDESNIKDFLLDSIDFEALKDYDIDSTILDPDEILNEINDLLKKSNLDITVNYYFQKNSLELYMSKIEGYYKFGNKDEDAFEEFTGSSTCKINESCNVKEPDSHLLNNIESYSNNYKDFKSITEYIDLIPKVNKCPLSYDMAIGIIGKLFDKNVIS